MSGKHILVVEDDRNIALSLEKVLQREGWEVRIARDASTGEAPAASFKPDLVILDWMLPDRDGREVLKSLRRHGQTPVPFRSRRILIPLPDRDFDVTEVAVPWRLLTRAGHEVVFATQGAGTVPRADPLLLTGVIFGQLGAAPEPRQFYRELERSPEFSRPIAWSAIEPPAFDGLLLPGGHAPGMTQLLDAPELQQKVAAFWTLARPVAAICHGVLVLARTRDPATGRSLLAGRRTTCLPKYMEGLAYLLTFWKLGRYYRTYPAYVEDEVRAALDEPARQFLRGPLNLGRRGSLADDGPAFVVQDDNYVSARWPGDAYLFSKRFLSLLEGS